MYTCAPSSDEAPSVSNGSFDAACVLVVVCVHRGPAQSARAWQVALLFFASDGGANVHKKEMSDPCSSNQVRSEGAHMYLYRQCKSALTCADQA